MNTLGIRERKSEKHFNYIKPKEYDMLICKDDEMELPVHICNTLEEACKWLGCEIRTLYNTKYKDGYMHYNSFKIELVKREV